MDTQLKKKFKTIKIIIPGLAIIFLIFLFSSIFFKQDQHIPVLKRDSILITEVKKGVFQDYINVSGRVIPGTEINIDSPEQGKVQNIFAFQGDEIIEGQPLLQMNNSQLENEYEILQTRIDELNQEIDYKIVAQKIKNLEEEDNLLDLEFTAKLKEKEYIIKQKLYDTKSISASDFEIAEIEYIHYKQKLELMHKRMVLEKDLFKASLIKEKTRLRLLQAERDNLNNRLISLKIVSPVSGKLTYFQNIKGQTKKQGENLAQISITDIIKFELAIDEFYINKVNPGSKGTISIRDESDQLEIYTLKTIFKQSEVQDSKFKIHMVFDGSMPSGVTIGQSFLTKIETGSNSGESIIIEHGAFYNDTGGAWIYVLDPGTGIASKRSIKITRQNPDYYEIENGLEQGEMVIISSYNDFKNNNIIKIN